eukprot:TRINITY_DN4252_c0_g3_i3.p2 TRINITY_DN4252_c0_g3~~TRINITY_DN4252_c0_g3_i3.p2  ORF type:complete len:172 (+),score=3.70 TRINITY_DN4252_c0_g3_i3:167-682(+)
MGRFPESVTVKIAKLAINDNSSMKVMRLVCKLIKNVVDKQITQISPVTVSSKRLVAASRQFPNIDALNLKQTVMRDDMVYFDNGNNLEEKKTQKHETDEVDKKETLVIPFTQVEVSGIGRKLRIFGYRKCEMFTRLIAIVCKGYFITTSDRYSRFQHHFSGFYLCTRVQPS